MYPASPVCRSSVRKRPCDPNMVTLTSPSITYCHSSALGCQCNSRSALGSRSRITPVIVVEIGNRVESTRHSRPPLNTPCGRLRQPKIFRKQRFGCVTDPIGDAEGAELGKITVVENQNEMCRFIPEAFEHVSVATRKVPDVARIEVVRFGLSG